MTKIKPNDLCYCNSSKKYKKCCFLKDFDKKQEDEQKYLNGQEISSDKINFCINYYKKMFEKHKIIDITDDITLDNYKTYHIKNYLNKIIMLIERTEKNQEVFENKSNDGNVDIMILYKGVYRVFNAKNILKYDEDIKNIITKRDLGENI
jgi:hypothetical protein